MLIDILLDKDSDYKNIIGSQQMAKIMNDESKDRSFQADTIFDEIQEKLNLITSDNISKLVKAFENIINDHIKKMMAEMPEGHSYDEIPEEEEKISKENALKLIRYYNAIAMSFLDYRALIVMFFREENGEKECKEELLFSQMIADKATEITGIQAQIILPGEGAAPADTTTSTPTGKIAPYPKQNDTISLPIINSLMQNSANVVSDNGEQVQLDEHQYKLILAVRTALIQNDKEGDGQHLFPLDSIVRYFKGADNKTDPTDFEREQVANMLEFFFKTPVYIRNPLTGEKLNFYFIHMDFLENAVINGQVCENVYKIYSVMPCNHTHNIYYYQFGLPKGYLNNLENSTLWSAIIDKSRDETDHTVDFELICTKLGVTKRNYSRRNVLYNKLIEMIKYYGFEKKIRIQRYFHGKLIEEKI